MKSKNTDDIRKSIEMMVAGRISPQYLVTHIGGLDSVMYATYRLPQLPGAKKLVYTHISMPLTAISDFREKGKEDPLYTELADICDRHNGLWSGEAEEYLLKNGNPLAI